MRGVMQAVLVVPAMALLLTGCATKDWVKESGRPAQRPRSTSAWARASAR